PKSYRTFAHIGIVPLGTGCSPCPESPFGFVKKHTAVVVSLSGNIIKLAAAYYQVTVFKQGNSITAVGSICPITYGKKAVCIYPRGIIASCNSKPTKDSLQISSGIVLPKSSRKFSRSGSRQP